MRGMLMTTDAIIASFIILLMVVFWVQMQSRLVDSEVREADAEGKTARLLALSEWILAQGKETGIERAAGREGTDAASGFGVKGASIGFWRVGEERELEDAGGARICIRRIFTDGGMATLLVVCA